MLDSTQPAVPQPSVAKITGLKKRQQIESASKYMFVWVTVAAVAVSFCAATGQYLFTKWAYNNRVLGAKYEASNILTQNVKNATVLKTEIDSLVANQQLASVKTNQSDSAIKSVLDALPLLFDPAALATSLQQTIVNRSGVSVESIAVQADAEGAASASKEGPQETRFTLVVNGSYDKVKALLHDLERTIRPMKVSSVSLDGTDAALRATIEVTTYFQEAKTINATEKELE